MTESEAPPVLSARTGTSTGLWATVVHNQRQQPCSRTALWNLPSVARLEVWHSVEELNRGTVHLRLGLVEHKQHDHRVVHNHPGPVFLSRPGLAVHPGGGSTGWEVPHLHQ